MRDEGYEVSPEKVHALAVQFAYAIRSAMNADTDLDVPEIFMACLETIGTVLSDMNCRGCRELSAAKVQELLPGLIEAALADADERYGDKPSHGHIH